MSGRNYFIKLNLDAMAADLDSLVTDRERLDWLAGFKVGARGRKVSEWTGAMRMGCDFGLRAWQEAQTYRATRSAGGKAKARKTAASKEQPTTNNQQPEMHTICNAHEVHMHPGCTPDAGIPGVGTPDPLPKPKHMTRFEAQYQTPDREVVALPFEETPQGKACAENRARIRAMRLAKESQSA